MELEPPYSWTMVDVECHHCLWNTHTIGQRQAWNAIMVLGKHTLSDNVERGMLSLAFYNTDGGTLFVVESRHRPCTTHTNEQRRAWRAIITFGQQKR